MVIAQTVLTMRRYYLSIFVLGIASSLGFCHLRNEGNGKTGRGDEHSETRRFEISDDSLNSTPEVVRTKSKERPNHPKPSIEETTELLKSTIIPVVDFPEDQTVTERVRILNELIQKAGIEPHRLRIVINATDPLRHMRFKDELRIREIPASVVLKYMVGRTKLRYRLIENGVVELISQDDESPSFVHPSVPPKPKQSPSAETDIFGNDPNAPEEDDPFAEP